MTETYVARSVFVYSFVRKKLNPVCTKLFINANKKISIKAKTLRCED
jgi:hypothetical protein